jgi:formate-dependent nitrite reductase membrane component NrfD
MEAGVWEWPILIDLWAAGVAGGGYFAAFLVDRLTGRKHKLLMQVATWVGVPLALLGVLLLILDLGNQIWFWHLVLRPSAPFLSIHPLSAMSIGTWVLAIWSACGTGLLVLWLAESEVPGFVLLGRLVPLAEILSWISFVLSPLVTIYTGVLLSSTNVALWATVFLPVLFVASAIFTGTAAIRLVTTLLGKDVPKEFGKASLILAVLQAVALVAFLVTVPARVLISGSLGLWFWVGVVLVGLIVPFGLELWAVQGKAATPLVLASTICVLLGGLVLRAVVVIGGQM